ncbi:MAG: ferritin family protein [Desulfobacterales bacterium]
MSYDFNADDIFEIAEQLERNGAKFYRNAAAGVSDTASKEFLIKLAGMEDDHEKTFKTLRATLAANEKTPTVFDPQDEAVLYLKALADTKVFFEKETTYASMKEILKSAIEAEKDSIVFYLGMKEAVPEKSGRNKIEAIIKEEMGHIRILSRELVDLKK